jgi:hypothetical protein
MLKKNSLMIFLLLLLTTVSARCFGNDQLNEDTAVDVVPMISEWANQMNVFPISLITGGRAGPIYDKENERNRWRVRYEWTFDQYELFYKLKYLAQTMSQKELTDVIAYLDKATPKEKALILTMIYIYERTHRKALDRVEGDDIYLSNSGDLEEYVRRPPILPILKPDKTVSRNQWKKWIGILEQYSKDDTVAFPAITKNDTFLKKVWEKDQSRVFKMAKSLGMIDPVKGVEWEKVQTKAVDWALDLERTKEIRRKVSNENRRKIDTLTEYIHTQYEHFSRSGLIYLNGNSSKYPKTVGDIATQLLMSRLQYDD